MSDGSKSTRGSRYRDPQVRKQVSIFLPASDWQALREEAARQRQPVTELCRRWLRPELDRLRQATSCGDARLDPRLPPGERGTKIEG